MTTNLIWIIIENIFSKIIKNPCRTRPLPSELQFRRDGPW